MLFYSAGKLGWIKNDHSSALRLTSLIPNTLISDIQETGKTLYSSSCPLICDSLQALNPSGVSEFHCRRWREPKTLLLLALICLWCHLFPSRSPVIGCWLQHLPWCWGEREEEDEEEPEPEPEPNPSFSPRRDDTRRKRKKKSDFLFMSQQCGASCFPAPDLTLCHFY